MAWTKTSIQGNGRNVLVLSETYTLPDTTTAYSSVIVEAGPNLSNNNRYITVAFAPSTISGTNLDFALMGAATESGTKVLLKDAIIADMTTSATPTKTAGTIDLNAYPAAFYFLRWISDADESGNTMDVEVYAGV